MGDGGVPGLSNEERQKPRGQIGHAENAHLLEEQYEQWRVKEVRMNMLTKMTKVMMKNGRKENRMLQFLHPIFELWLDY